ncbi:MAG: methyltransferase domain-containing protein [Thiobacillus sp.]|nr:methyltransferase domain-containing protein [Thiobacillus sp.]
MLDLHHPFFLTFERLMAESAARTPVYDLGTSARFAKEVGLVRHLFDENTYRAGGYRPDMTLEMSSCDFDCDIQNLSGIADGEAGSVLSISVLEHVLDPHRAVREMYRILQPGGLAIVSVPFFVAYHGKSGRDVNPVYERGSDWQTDSSHGGYGDFWRFTHEGLALMFAEAGFSRVDVYPIDGWLISRLEVLGLYRRLARVPLVRMLIHKFDRPRLGRTATMHFVRAEKSV